MSTVRSEIMDAQNDMQRTDYVIMEILNNIQNLYGLANTREINKIQDEFYRLYEKNDIGSSMADIRISWCDYYLMLCSTA